MQPWDRCEQISTTVGLRSEHLHAGTHMPNTLLFHLGCQLQSQGSPCQFYLTRQNSSLPSGSKAATSAECNGVLKERVLTAQPRAQHHLPLSCTAGCSRQPTSSAGRGSRACPNSCNAAGLPLRGGEGVSSSQVFKEQRWLLQNLSKSL